MSNANDSPFPRFQVPSGCAARPAPYLNKLKPDSLVEQVPTRMGCTSSRACVVHNR